MDSCLGLPRPRGCHQDPTTSPSAPGRCAERPSSANHPPMKHRILPFLASLSLLALTGCESMTFAKYDGPPRAWPTGSAFTDGVFDVPMYRGWPEKPYEVLGFVQFSNPNIDWNRGDMKEAARKARAAGGDAIILMPRGADPSPTAAAARQQLGISPSQTAAVVVKWK